MSETRGLSMRSTLRPAFALALAATALLVGCGLDEVTPARVYVSSFEGGMDSWYANGTDVTNPPVNWNIQRAVDMSRDSISSVRFQLDNSNGKGKIWMERAFSADSSGDYRVRVSYQFATRDYGTAGLWQIIAGAGPRAVSFPEELIYHADTGNGSGSDVGYVWRYRDYTFDIRSSSTGKVFVSIGVWGTTLGARTYYVDQVVVSLQKR
ncbi:MAG: hypothetical protein WAW06_03490 [bacterium]